MNYLKQYKRIIRNAKRLYEDRKLDKNNGGYYEKHHAIPKCIMIFKNKDHLMDGWWNLVLLTAREHFIAHLLLWKFCNSYYGETHLYTHKMIKSVVVNSGDNLKTNSRIFHRLKQQHSQSMKGENNPNFGAKSFTEETIKKLSDNMAGENHWAYGRIVPNKEKEQYIGEKHPSHFNLARIYKIYFDNGKIKIIRSLKTFCKIYGYNRHHLSVMCNNKNPSRKRHKDIIKIEEIIIL